MNEKKIINVLLIDDDKEDYKITREVFSEIQYSQYEITWIATYEEAIKEMQKKAYDIFLLDYNLGAQTGLDLIDEIPEINWKIPIILLTSIDNHDIDIMAMKKGVSDFICKNDLTAGQLERSIRYSLEKKRSEEQIFDLAYYDPLTHLPNRVFFREQLNFALAHAFRYKRNLAVMFLDLDNFKIINDSLGHHIGDLLLQQVAQRLNIAVRKGDIVARENLKTYVDLVARLGGDEFTIILTEVETSENASLVAQRIIQLLNRPFSIEGHEILTGVSIGISICPEDGMDSDTLLKYADNAMYHAKSQGKNCFQYYQKSMNDNALGNIHIVKNIRAAGKLNEFLLNYQPKMNIKTGELIGFEALIRWQNKEKGLIQPNEFIPFAEKHNLIGFITDWVVNEVCRQSLEWKEQNLNLLPVSINMPVNHFKKDDMIDFVINKVESYHLSPQLFELEVTESVFSLDMEMIISNIEKLRSKGFVISIDDFGMGFSSLNRLKLIPCHKLKIDKSFVQGICNNSSDEIIINSIISLGHGLGMEIVAEGVETKDQFDFLKNKNCDSFQGYLLSKPLPKEDIAEILKHESHGQGIGKKLLDILMGNSS